MSLADEVKTKLQAHGWHIRPGLYSTMSFYAWRRIPDLPDCQSNKKPPCIAVEFYSCHVGDHLWESCEVKIAGDAGSDQWVSLSAYSIRPSELMDKLPHAVAIVTAAWVAACEA